MLLPAVFKRVTDRWNSYRTITFTPPRHHNLSNFYFH